MAQGMKRRVLIEIPSDDRVDVMGEKYGAQPCLAGRRFLVAKVLAELGTEDSGYETVQDVAEDFDISPQKVRDALLWSAGVMGQSFTVTEGDLRHLLGDVWVVKDKTTGWWWRPRATGYTQELLAAGAVDEKTAESWAHRRSPDRHGHYTDEAMRLTDALAGLAEGTVMRVVLDLVPEVPTRHELDMMRHRLEVAETRVEEARAAAEEIRDAWVPEEKHTEFPWEMK